MFLPSPDVVAVDDGIGLPLLRVIELTHVGVEEIICQIITHRSACGKPIKAVAFHPTSLVGKFPEQVEWMKG